MEPKPKLKAGFARAAHFAGNVLLGFALGLACYYGITSALSALAQNGLRDDMAGLGAIGIEEPLLAAPAQDEWDGWEEEDRAYWDALEDGGVFGRLLIEKLGLDVAVVKGTERADLMNGPGWIVQTDMPGKTGNCGISGHRTTYGAPFRDVDVLVPGDRIVFFSPYRRYTYEVTRQLIVRPTEVEVVASTERPMLTLTACHPPYSAAFRIIVQGRLVDVARLDNRGLTRGRG